jgi:tetratricopeptide (TPR) repeat protein
VKKILDKLLTRQARLMGELARQDAPEARARPARPKRSTEELARLREAEEAAVEQAFAHLATGDVAAAAAVLAPHRDDAQHPSTLTTLSRIASLQGDVDGALALLDQAEALDPGDLKTAYFKAELLQQLGRHRDAIHYRRRVALSQPDAPAQAYLRLIQAVVKAAPPGGKVPPGEVQFALTKMLAAADLTDELRLDAAQSLYDLPPQRAAAVKLLAEADPCPPGRVDVEVQWLTLAEACRRTARPSQRVDGAGAPGRRPMAAALQDVTVDPGFDWIPVLQSRRFALAGLAPRRAPLRRQAPESPLLLTSKSAAVLRLHADAPVHAGPALLVGGHPDPVCNLLEHVASLCIASALDLDRGLPLVIGDDLPAEQVELLGLLGFGDREQVKVHRGQPVRFADLWVPSKLLGTGHWVDPLLPQWLRASLAPHAPTSDPARGTRYYVIDSAVDAASRLVDAAAVQQRLGALGYETIVLQGMGFAERAGLLAHATDVVGLAGPLMQSMMLAPPGARLGLLQPRQARSALGPPYFEGLVTACGHHAAALPCQYARVEPGQDVEQAALRVDLDALAGALA